MGKNKGGVQGKRIKTTLYPNDLRSRVSLHPSTPLRELLYA